MSPYIKKIHTFPLFLSNGCNKKCHVSHFNTLRHLSKLENTIFYINFSFLSHVVLTDLSCFCRFFHYMIFIFHSSKDWSKNHFSLFGNFLLFKALTFCKLFLWLKHILLYFKDFHCCEVIWMLLDMHVFHMWVRLWKLSLPGKSSRNYSNI